MCIRDRPQGAVGGVDGGDERECLESRQAKSRAVYERALRELKDADPDAKEERVMLLEAWKSFESTLPPEFSQVADVKAKLPKRVKRKRSVAAVMPSAPLGE